MSLFLILSLPLFCLAATDYCSLCENGFHTMCLYPKDGPASSCLDYRKVNFSQSQKRYIVDIHNDIRNHVASGQEKKGKLGNQPPAANMFQLEWEEELATIAQRWVDQCIPVNATLQHDSCKITSKFRNVGQNILTAVTNETEVAELAILILNWYKQVVDVIPSDIEYFEGIKRGQFLIGQYTQLVWANTRAVGCGMAIYKDSPRGFYNQRLVCNYGPGGNIIGQPVYLQGIPCSKCPKGRCDDIRKNLCESSMSKRSTRSKMIDLEITSTNSNYTTTKNNTYRVFSKEKGKSSSMPYVDTLENLFLINTSFSIHKSKGINYTNFKHQIILTNLTIKVPKLEETETSQYWITPETYVRLQRATGKWYNGECKCDIIYRSQSSVLASAIYLHIICVAIIFGINI